MKLRKKDRIALTGVYSLLLSGEQFLQQSRVLVCVQKSVSTTTLDFTNEQGECCTSIDKQIGSELAMLRTGIHRLKTLLLESEEP